MPGAFRVALRPEQCLQFFARNSVRPGGSKNGEYRQAAARRSSSAGRRHTGPLDGEPAECLQPQHGSLAYDRILDPARCGARRPLARMVSRNTSGCPTDDRAVHSRTKLEGYASMISLASEIDYLLDYTEW